MQKPLVAGLVQIAVPLVSFMASVGCWDAPELLRPNKYVPYIIVTLIAQAAQAAPWASRPKPQKKKDQNAIKAYTDNTPSYCSVLTSSPLSGKFFQGDTTSPLSVCSVQY